ncbi:MULTISPECIES: caspase family protein [unclassified Imperialibacter]|uniref:caspase family protein n=1 Tax=unclassified Imperialibacter TaxID=2629706 RepID=UPI001252551B|nr:MULTISPECIES: caspase family protein [unclassified Imperialibacter]CAD5293143.1 Caspase domain-containing protein [Imperialibacter sp. 89]CAD5294224.1 Caspase domain-containing protein [Imperialibacter sp. 75]VVT18481.1 Caspase domain-containing protein [Imperialibacter sp. EC-SDR9]
MKLSPRYILLPLLTLVSPAIFGQVVATRTNQVHIDVTKPANATTLPRIVWELPRLEYTNSQENRVDVKATVVSTEPLKSVRLALKTSNDGEPSAVKNVELESPLLTSIQQNLYLPDGQNYIEIVAETEMGGIVSDFRSVVVGMNALKDAVAIDRKDYGLFFATDQYDNWGDLVNPIYDSKAIGKELEERYGFEVRIVENIDQNDVFTILREYALRNYKPQDQLFIFFAGHGQYDETFGEGYVVARNSIANDPGKNTYISHNRLRNNIDNIKCDHIFLVMDVCFGGTFDPVLASSRSVYSEVDNVEFMVKKLAVKTRKYLTSGGKEYVSDGIAGKHSPFASRFLEALKTNGGEDRLLTLTELNSFMERLQTTPRFGAFGSDQDASDFLFIAK